MIILNMDSTVSPTYGNQEGTADVLRNFKRMLALPREVEHWSRTTLRA